MSDKTGQALDHVPWKVLIMLTRLSERVQEI